MNHTTSPCQGECQGEKRLKVRGLHSTLCLVTKKLWGARQAPWALTGSFIHSMKDLEIFSRVTPSSEISGLFLEVTLMKEKQKLPTKFYTLVLTLLGKGKTIFVSPCAALGVLGTGSVFRRECWPGRQGLGLGARLLVLHVSKQNWAGRCPYMWQHRWLPWTRNRGAKKSSRLGAVQEAGFPFDCPIWQADRILLSAALIQCLVWAASKVGTIVTCGYWGPEVLLLHVTEELNSKLYFTLISFQ